MAQLLKKELKLKEVRVKEGTDFTIIHPRSPSIVVNFGRKYLCVKKQRNRQDALEKEARSVYQGLVAFFREIHKK